MDVTWPLADQANQRPTRATADGGPVSDSLPGLVHGGLTALRNDKIR
jgi:hypothetical protein